MSSANSRAATATSTGSPDNVISLPRTWMSQLNDRSISRSSSSLEPSSATMLWAPGTTMSVDVVVPRSAMVTLNASASGRHRAG